jgi:Tfp pilus assembly protein PilF
MYKEAEYYIKKALYVDPNNEGIHFNLGKIYLAEGRLKDARDEFQKVVEITSKKQNKEFQRKATRYIKSIDKID